MTNKQVLECIKLVHTLAWAFFVACILAIPVYAWVGRFDMAIIFIGIVLIEGIILILNGWRCPLTILAEKYTTERHHGFDIYLPSWFAQHNKLFFTVLYVVGVLITLIRWELS